jgi:hypothetical protein
MAVGSSHATLLTPAGYKLSSLSLPAGPLAPVTIADVNGRDRWAGLTTYERVVYPHFTSPLTSCDVGSAIHPSLVNGDGLNDLVLRTHTGVYCWTQR